MRILIVDDNIADRYLITNLIKEAKKYREVQTDESSCLEEAISKIKNNNYDIILLDLILPESDGLDTVQAIISTMEQTSKNIPIIILTGSDNYKIGRKIWGLGIKDYLIKDEIDKGDLLRALNFAAANIDEPHILKH